MGFTDLAAPLLLVALVLGYLLGSIPFGLLLTKAAGLGDIRDIGSGNIGATNALRTGNRWVAIGTLIGDAGKGAVAVLLSGLLAAHTAADQTWMMSLAALGAFLGHLYPVWLGFTGGKGISTFISRYSSLSALVAALLTPVYLAWLDRWELVGLSVLLAALVYIAHRGNIGRLLSGTEPRIGQKKAEDTAEG
jgi:glycerol-3-phosphate acyltransferase PlsY